MKLRRARRRAWNGDRPAAPAATRRCGGRARLRAALALGVVAGTLAVGGPAAGLTTISVTTTADELNADGDCSLREAITAVNTQAPVDACPAGTNRSITISVAGTIALGSSLPPVETTLNIDGPGAADLTIDGGDSVRAFDLDEGGLFTLEGVTVANGSASAGSGIFSLHTAVKIENSVFSENSATGRGGAVFVDQADLTVTNSTFSGNSAREGGAIYNFNGRTRVTGSTFSENSAGNTVNEAGGAISILGGGGIFGVNTIENSTFSRNNAAPSGGAIFADLSTSATLNITNSTFAGNSATWGGAISHYFRGAVTVTNSTFTGNSAVGDPVCCPGVPGGGAIHNAGTLTLRNSIVASSPAGGNCANPITDGGGNLSWPDSTCLGVNQDPLLDPAGLQDNGGATQTIALQPGSPATGAAVAASCPDTDQRGVFRPQGAACDMGAYEVVRAAADYDGDGDTDVGFYRTGDGVWVLRNQPWVHFPAQGGDIWVPGDYDGNGTTDIAFYRPSTGVWVIRNQPWVHFPAQSRDLLVPGDYDGDGATDIAFYRPSTGVWVIRNQSWVHFPAQSEDVLLPADYDGDGAMDIAFYRPSTGVWVIRNQSWVHFPAQSEDVLLPADYDGDGATDIAFHRPSTGVWIIRNQPWVHFPAQSGDVLLPADYDGDGDTDIAFYQESTGVWVIGNQPWAHFPAQAGDVLLPVAQVLRPRVVP